MVLSSQNAQLRRNCALIRPIKTYNGRNCYSRRWKTFKRSHQHFYDNNKMGITKIPAVGKLY